MRYRYMTALVCLGLLFFIGSGFPPCADGQPPGLEKQGKVPTGFGEGEKTGWRGEYPPGWEKRNEQERQEWREQVRKGREKVSRSARERNMTEEEADSAADDYERGVRRGLDPKESGALVEEKIKKGKKGRDLSDSMTEESEKRLRGKEKSSRVKPELDQADEKKRSGSGGIGRNK